MRAKLLATLAVALPALMVLAACGDSSPPRSQRDADTPTAAAAAANAAAALAAAEAAAAAAAAAMPEPDPAETLCAPTLIAAATPNGHDRTLNAALAASVASGSAYTLYLADYPLDVAALEAGAAPADNTLFTVTITVFAAGTVFNVEGAAPAAGGGGAPAGGAGQPLSFTVATHDGPDFNDNGAGRRGTLTLSPVGRSVCGTIAYTDNVRTLAGAFRAPVTAF